MKNTTNRCHYFISLLILLTSLLPAMSANIGNFSMPFVGNTSVGIFNQQGQLLRTLLNISPQKSGAISLEWDGRDNFGKIIPNGQYQWRAIATQAAGVDDGSVGEMAPVTYGVGEHSQSVNGVAYDPAGNLYQISYWEEPHFDLRRWNADGTPGWSKNFFGGCLVTADADFVYTVRCDSADGNIIERFRCADGSALSWPSTERGFIIANTGTGNGVNGISVSTTYLWVANTKKNRVEIYNKTTGALISTFDLTNPTGIIAESDTKVWVCHDENSVTSYSNYGVAADSITGLNIPYALAIGGPTSSLYIGLVGSGEIQKYNKSTRQLLASYFSAAVPGPISDNKVYWPWDKQCSIAVNAAGKIALTDLSNHRVLFTDANGVVTSKHYSEFQPAPCTDPTVDPNMMLSTWIQYAINYTTTNYGSWYPAYNWMPADKQYYSAGSVIRKLANGKKYLFYFVNKSIAIYALSDTGMRRCAIIGGDSGLYNWSDTNGDGIIDDAEKTARTGTAGFQTLAPGWWIDQQGNAWIATWANATVKIPMEGFDSADNPTYNWDNRVTVIPPDNSTWAFRPTNIRIDPINGDIYRIGTIAQARDCYYWMGGTAIDRTAANGSRISVMPFPLEKAGDIRDYNVVVATDSDGNYFYTGHSWNDQIMVRMYTNDGLQVTTCRFGEPSGYSGGWMDHGLSLTAFTHPNGNHYAYAEEVYWGKSVRFRIDNLASLTRFSGNFDWTSAPLPTVTITASDAIAAETDRNPGTFTILRDSITGPLTVNYTLEGDVLPARYTPTLTGSVTIPDGSDKATITITPVDDIILQGTKTLRMVITANASYLIAAPGLAEIPFLDNDTTVTAEASVPDAYEATLAPGTVTFWRDNSQGDLSVKYAVSTPRAIIADASASSYYNNNVHPRLSYDEKLPTMWSTAGNSFYEGKDDNPAITLQLDQTYTLNHFLVANYSGGENGRGARDVDVLISLDGINYTSVGIKRFNQGTVDPNSLVYQKILLGDVEAQYVKLVIKNNYYNRTFGQGTSYDGNWANGSITGFSEIAFYQPGASPAQYQPLSGSILIPDGQLSATVNVVPKKDSTATGDLPVALTILNDNNYKTGSPRSAIVTIHDMEPPLPIVTIAATDNSASENGPDTATFTFTRNNTTGPLTVKYSTAATLLNISSVGASSWHYAAPPERACDGDNATTWQTNGNSKYEGKDDAPYITFNFANIQKVGRLSLINYYGHEYYRSLKNVEIFVSTDDVNFTSLGIQQFTLGANDAANAIIDHVELGGVSAKRVMLDVKTNYYGRTFDQGISYDGDWANPSIAGCNEVTFFSGGNALSDDYSPILNGTITIPDGQLSATITITPIHNVTGDGDKTLQLSLLPQKTYRIGSEKNASATLLDFVAPPAPIINSFSPTSGNIGQQVVITGERLDQVTGVSFNGVSANDWHINSATSITATVPLAASSGKITLTTPHTTVDSITDFIVIVPPLSGISLQPAGGNNYRTGNLLSFTAIPVNGANVRYSFSCTYQELQPDGKLITLPYPNFPPGDGGTNISFTPTIPGSYTLVVSALEQQLPGARTFRAYYRFKVYPANISGVTLNSSQTDGTDQVTLTAIPEGGDGAGAKYLFTASYKDISGAEPQQITVPLPTVSSTDNTITFTAPKPGMYTCSVTAWDASGNMKFVRSRSVLVRPANITGVSFLAVQAPGTSNVTLTAIPRGGDGAGATYLYTASYLDVQSGLQVPVALPTTPTADNPITVSLTVPGTYTIKLTAWDATRQVSYSYTKSVKVLPTNMTGISYLAVQTPGTSNVTLTAIPLGGNGAGATYLYTASYLDVKSGLQVPVTLPTTPTTDNPITVALTVPGMYTITLTAWDASKQCRFIYKKSVSVKPINITGVNILTAQAGGGSPIVTLTALPKGGDGAGASFLFTASLLDMISGLATPLTVQDEKSIDNPITFTTPSPGFYTFGVTAWDASGQMQFVAYPRTICITSPALTGRVALVIADSKKRSPQITGTEIPLKVYFYNATDTAIGLRYWFRVKDLASGFTTDLTANDFQQSTFNWTPSTSGDFQLSVTVTDPASGYVVSGTSNFKVTAP